MTVTNFSILDYLVFIGLLVVSSFIGVFFWFKSRKNATNEEFLTGSRQLGVFPVTMSLVASFMSTNTLLGQPAEVYQMGTQISMHIISLIVAVVVAAEVFLPLYCKIELLSVNEYLAKRFNSKHAQLAGTIGYLLTTAPYLACVLYGPSLALSSVTPLSISTSILVCGTVCTLYTSIGGIKAVIWTDVLQCFLMFFGVIMVIIQGIIEAGGFAEVWRINDQGGRLKFFNMKFDLYNHDNFWNVVVGTLVLWTACYCITQHQVQRYCSMGSARKAKRTLYFNLPLLLLLAIMAILCGMVIYAKYHDCDPVTLGLIERHDQLMPYFVMDTLSRFPGLPGLFVACVFSGSLSTLSSGLNSLAAVTWEDLIKPNVHFKSEKTALNVTKLFAMSYGLLTIVMAFGVGGAGTVLQASMALNGSILGSLFGFFVLAAFYPYATSPGCLCGLIASTVLSLSLSIGSQVFPRPKISLPTSTDNCPAPILNEALPTSSYIQYYDNPEGLARFFHISYLLLSVIGFITCIIIGALASLCIGDRDKCDDSLMTPLHKYLFPWYKTKNTYNHNKKNKNRKLVFDNGNQVELSNY